ncbi:MAG: YfgM family protein [Cellvibrionaceae bacterium]
MADNMTDDEQLQVLKNWWKENGKSLILVVSLALIGYFGWQWWNKYQRDYAEGASAIYDELAEAIVTPNGEDLSDEKRKTAQFLIEKLQNDYGRSLYAVNASLLAAKLAVDEGDLVVAEEQLNKAMEQGDEDTNVITSIRLARVYLAQEKYDDALALANYDKDDTFTGLFAALRGDIFAGKGDVDNARSAYAEALDALPEDSTLQRRLIEIKLSDLAGDQG